MGIETVVMLMLRDGLALPSGSTVPSDYSMLLYCRIPADWLDGAASGDATDLWQKGFELKPERLEQICAALYGANWRQGNSDGSRYVVLGHGLRRINPGRAAEKPWQIPNENPEIRVRCYVAKDDGTLRMGLPSML